MLVCIATPTPLSLLVMRRNRFDSLNAFLSLAGSVFAFALSSAFAGFSGLASGVFGLSSGFAGGRALGGSATAVLSSPHAKPHVRNVNDASKRIRRHILRLLSKRR